MSKRQYELDTRVLSVFFFVAIPFIAFGALVVIHMARGSLQNTMGQGLEQRALETRQLVERYVADQFVHLQQIAADPSIRAAVAGVPPLADAERLEKGWAGNDPAVVGSIVGSPAAAALRQAAQVFPAYKVLQLTDASGRLVASNVRAGRLLNGDAPWFRSVTTTDIDTDTWVGDIQRPPNSSTFLLELSAPLRHAGDGRVLGVLRVLVDSYDMYNGVLAPVRLGRTGHAVLVRSTDGLVLASDENERVLRDRFAGFQYIQAARGERRGFWLAPELTDDKEGVVAPRRVVGFSPVIHVPNAHWMVVVEQDLSEAIAPVEGITWYLFVHFIGVFATAILLALYFSFKLEAPVIEEELHLHEEHVPASMRSSAS